MTDTRESIAIIGAGPVGLFTAFLLAQGGIAVTVIEAAAGINQSPRAVAYFPPVLEEFTKAGIVEDVIAAGEKNADGCDWRDADGNLLAGIDPPPNDPTFAVCLSQPELGEILLRKALETGKVKILFGEKFQRLEQRDGAVAYWTENQESGLETERVCRYLVGADGGRSSVRKKLGIHLEGYTFESLQFVAVNFQYDLRAAGGWKAASFIVDPVDWGIVVKRGKGTSWRFATGVTKSDPESISSLTAEAIQLVKDRLARILPGNTDEIRYEEMAPYTVHQRCASDFRKGDVLLAGDAAHLNSPVGGLGLTTGLLDATHLAKALHEVVKQGVSPNVLTTYADTRRRIFLERTNPISTANLMRLCSREPAHVKERGEVLARLKEPLDFITKSRIGLPDFSLTSTSDKFFDTCGEVTWFISVTRIPGWTEEEFRYQYKGVHAGMTRKVAEKAPVIRSYNQLRNAHDRVAAFPRPSWDYVTCLTWPSLFIINAGFQDPDYQEHAGKHIFCRLDQEGCVMARVQEHLKRSSRDPVQCLLYHKRQDAHDEFSPAWFTERAVKLRSIWESETGIYSYILWRDVTPRTASFFHGTQFSGGSWLQYKGLETFGFEDADSASSFLDKYRSAILGEHAETTQLVIGVSDWVI
ncbi:FAD binding domain-containing protein [Aspergillus pseudoustus]|uniref:FAD binding domain-containing protein n=1 Tax=Aspergillus pseudoustus TaxID=1810923 RepID=A0ABR4IB56_9EURO